MLAEAGSGGAELQEIDEPSHVSGGPRNKGKGRAEELQSQLDLDLEMAMGLDMSERGALGDNEMDPNQQEDVVEARSVTDDEEGAVFDLMRLPPELRLEIYRACLTRPYPILLSKREQPQAIDPDVEFDQDYEVCPELGSSLKAANCNQLQNSTSSSPTQSGRALGIGAQSDRSGVRGGRRMRLLRTHARSSGSGSGASRTLLQAASDMAARHASARRKVFNPVSEPPRNQTQDPLLINILRASKQVYKEARSVIYSENIFTLDLNTAMPTLACLHQRSRRQIKHIELEIPTYNEILERFQETVRLHLRYCSGLKTFVISMPFTLPGADGSGTTGNTTVYANGFDILRWLPQGCNIVLKGHTCVEIDTVVNKHLTLSKSLDKVSYGALQHSSNSYQDSLRETERRKKAATVPAGEVEDSNV
jgi:hypothetical protein